MKNYKIIYIILLCGFISCGLISCDDFLTEAPKGQLATDQFFDSPEDASSFVNRLYRIGAAADFYQSNGFSLDNAHLGAVVSGYFDPAEKRADATQLQSLQIDAESQNEFFNSIWAGHYDAITQANVSIQRIPDMEISEQLKLNLLSEARFFRALNYFSLVKIFGDVPLITQPIEGVGDDTFVPRDGSESVYEQIVADLDWAVNQGNLPVSTFANNNFRITEDTALTLLSDVYLHMSGYPLQATDNYANAAQTARTVIQNNVHRLIEHGPTLEESAYNIMRTSDTADEYIYSIEFDENISTNGTAWIAIPRAQGPAEDVVFNDVWNAYRPIDPFIQMFDENVDLRIQNQQFFYNSLEYEGVSYQLTEYAPWLWFEERALFETARGSKNTPVYRYAEVLLIAAEAIAQSEGVTSEAVGYLADVRERAYWQTDRSVIESELIGLSTQAFVEEVWKERVREFPFEYKIWPDIQRTRKYPVPSQNVSETMEFIDVIGASNNFGQTFQDHQLLFPIPQEELETNPSLEQNPGY